MTNPEHWPAGLAQLLCFPVEQGINHALQYDPASQQRLSVLAGQLLRLTVTDLPTGPLSISARLLTSSEHASSVQISLVDTAQTDLELRGSLYEFSQLIRSENPLLALSVSGVQIEGDQRLAEELLLIASDLEVDWEAMMQPFIGGMAAHAVGEQARTFDRWRRQTTASLKMASRDFVLDETGNRHPAAALEPLIKGVSQLSEKIPPGVFPATGLVANTLGGLAQRFTSKGFSRPGFSGAGSSGSSGSGSSGSGYSNCGPDAPSGKTNPDSPSEAED